MLCDLNESSGTAWPLRGAAQGCKILSALGSGGAMREAPVTVKLCWEPPPSNCHDGVLPPSQYEIWGKGQGRGKFPIQEDGQRRSPSMAPVRAAALACAILRHFHTGRAETGLEGSFSRWNVFGDARTLSSLRRKHSTIAGASAWKGIVHRSVVILRQLRRQAVVGGFPEDNRVAHQG